VQKDSTPANIDPKSTPNLLELAPQHSADIRAQLAQTLPEHMVPNAIAALSHIPISASGKINKRALPELDAQSTAPFEAPKGPTESLIAQNIAELIAAETGSAPDQISRHDSFFALGGHSLMAVRLIARLQDATDTHIPLRALFDAKTIKDLAEDLKTAQKNANLPKITKINRAKNIKLSSTARWIRTGCAQCSPHFMPAMKPCASRWMCKTARRSSALQTQAICPGPSMI